METPFNVFCGRDTKLDFEVRRQSRVTRLGEFSPKGRHFTLGGIIKFSEVAQTFGLLFPKFRLCINFDKKWVGRIFHKLIWSPWKKTLQIVAKVCKNC
jgi:hypothetical protein